MSSPNPTQSGQTTVITHIFDAPRELVFKAWSSAEHVARWWGPHDFTIPYLEWDLRVGAKFLIHMRDADGTLYPARGVFEEVLEPERIVFRSQAVDGGTDMASLEVLNTVTFEALGGKTRLIVHAVVLKTGPDADFYLEGMVQGWTESFEKLAATLG